MAVIQTLLVLCTCDKVTALHMLIYNVIVMVAIITITKGLRQFYLTSKYAETLLLVT